MTVPLDTPVAFLIFNRPDYTRRVFEAIAAARPRTLLVVADGPRVPTDASLCRQARAVLDGVDWDCDVRTDFSEQNLGCRRRVASGLDWVFRQSEAAIILEDDCLPHPDFFGFCERMLDRYRDDERLMMVAGMNYLGDRLDIPEGYTFSRYFPVWGWATWRRAWAKYDDAMTGWPALRAQKQLRSLYGPSGFAPYLEMLFDSGASMDTWDIPWVVSCVFQNGLSVVPRANLVSNIGVVGTHTGKADRHQGLPTFALPPGDLVHPRLVFPDARYDDVLAREVLRPLVPSPLRRSYRKAGRAVKRRLQQTLARFRAAPAEDGR